MSELKPNEYYVVDLYGKITVRVLVRRYGKFRDADGTIDVEPFGFGALGVRTAWRSLDKYEKAVKAELGRIELLGESRLAAIEAARKEETH